MNITLKTAGVVALRTLVIASASLALVSGAQAQGHSGRGGGGQSAHAGPGGYHGGGHYGGQRYGDRRGGNGWVWGGLGLGLGLGLAGYYASPWYATEPGYVIVDPPVVYDNPQPVYGTPVPVRSSAPPQPVIYPRNGQGAAQTDADADACSQWAGKQRNATVDASVFQRGIAACMDARGYTLR